MARHLRARLMEDASFQASVREGVRDDFVVRFRYLEELSTKYDCDASIRYRQCDT